MSFHLARHSLYILYVTNRCCNIWSVCRRNTNKNARTHTHHPSICIIKRVRISTSSKMVPHFLLFRFFTTSQNYAPNYVNDGKVTMMKEQMTGWKKRIGTENGKNALLHVTNKLEKFTKKKRLSERCKESDKGDGCTATKTTTAIERNKEPKQSSLVM